MPVHEHYLTLSSLEDIVAYLNGTHFLQDDGDDVAAHAEILEDIDLTLWTYVCPKDGEEKFMFDAHTRLKHFVKTNTPISLGQARAEIARIRLVCYLMFRREVKALNGKAYQGDTLHFKLPRVATTKG